MKLTVLAIFYSFVSLSAVAQPGGELSVDSLKNDLVNAKADTTRVLLLKALGTQYLLSDPPTAKAYFQQGYELARSVNYKQGEADCLRFIGNVLKRQGQYPNALNNFFQALSISESIQDSSGISAGLGHIGDIYSEQGDHYKARRYFMRAKEIDEKINKEHELILMLSNIGKSYYRQNIADSAFLYLDQCYKLSTETNSDFILDALFTTLGQLHANNKNDAEAMNYFQKSIPYSQSKNAHGNLSDTYLGIASLYERSNQIDSCILYSKNSLASAQTVNYVKGIMASSQLLSEVYDGLNKEEAYKYYKISMAAKDSLFNAEKVRQLQELGFAEQQRLEALENAKLDYQNRIRSYTLLSLVGTFMLIAMILLINNRNKIKANRMLHQQKEEIQRTLTELKTTQSQLIQSEKMASLGELTAGIAHEIQNPLNFVNNFSEVSEELLNEMKDDLAKGRIENALSLANDALENQKKINHHGKRADAIVKGMLLHSRTSTGQKEDTNINALTDEYLRLAYHGMRAKDKSFNVTTRTDFDQNAGIVSIVPQDIGRVILNLLNNAFYAVAEKGKQLGEKFEPAVSISTKRVDGTIRILIEDNGTGIPQNVAAKIFQPFFTTKPTGHGTGLGLSISYDIVKAHGGNLKVESTSGQGSTFTIQLPV
jgi:signal transduction histidine kinase